VTYGHSKDRRPDLKQIVYGMLMTADGGVPVFGEVMDGNQADTGATAAFFARIRHLVADPRQVVCVSDCKGWSGSVVSLISSQRMRLLSRLPRNHRSHREIMAKPWKPDGRMVNPQARSRRDEPAYYEYMGADIDCPFSVVHQATDKLPQRTEAISVPARAVRVFSSALLAKKMSTLKRLRLRDERTAQAFIRDAQKRAYACKEDAQRAAARDQTAQQRATLNIQATVIRHDGGYRRGRGRPPAHAEPGIDAVHWRIAYTTAPVPEQETAARLRESATFVIIRTRTPGWDISDAEMMRRYKGQYYNEHGFSWLKSEAAMNPIFLKTPHRIATLGFVYCVGLMVWSLIQRSSRAYLAEMKQTLPYHRGRRGKKITTRFLFEVFQDMMSQHLTMPDGTVHHYIHGLSRDAARACRSVGTQLNVFRAVAK
jgi:transposase